MYEYSFKYTVLDHLNQSNNHGVLYYVYWVQQLHYVKNSHHIGTISTFNFSMAHLLEKGGGSILKKHGVSFTILICFNKIRAKNTISNDITTCIYAPLALMLNLSKPHQVLWHSVAHVSGIYLSIICKHSFKSMINLQLLLHPL